MAVGVLVGAVEAAGVGVAIGAGVAVARGVAVACGVAVGVAPVCGVGVAVGEGPVPSRSRSTPDAGSAVAVGVVPPPSQPSAYRALMASRTKVLAILRSLSAGERLPTMGDCPCEPYDDTVESEE